MSFELQLSQVAARLLEHACHLGASSAQVHLTKGQGISLELRQGRVRSRREQTHSNIVLTVYRGQRQGTSHSTDCSEASLREMAARACEIARHTAADPYAGLPEPQALVASSADLQLDFPWPLSLDKAHQLALRIEQGIAEQGANVQCDGARVNSYRIEKFMANTLGFAQGHAQSLHSLAASALAGHDQHRQRGHATCQQRSHLLLEPPEQVGARAARQALAYLDEQPISNGIYPVLFDPQMASTLLNDFVNAASGRALFSHDSYLRQRLGQQVMAEHLSLAEDPFVPGALASAPFDHDGVAGQRRLIVERGRLNGYLLSTYSGRRLGLPSTGNASGPYNLKLSSVLTTSGDDRTAMLARLGRGLLITELGGERTHLLTGSYSRTAKGFWVENGLIAHAVTGLTLAGDLDSMLRHVVAVGSDTLTHGPITCGSLLLEGLHVGAH